MFGEPFDLKLNSLIANAIPSEGFLEGFDKEDANPTLHTKEHTNNGEDLTVICMEGPQFSTRAESKLYRSWVVPSSTCRFYLKLNWQEKRRLLIK